MKKPRPLICKPIRLGLLQVTATLTLGLAAASPANAQDAKGNPPAQSLPAGVRTFTVGNSFHFWVANLLAYTASEAGIKNHVTLGYSMIGGSWVLQHWNLPDPNNPIKAALKEGKVDVLTLSGMYPPDEGVEKFARFGLEYNPNLRVTLQEFWLPNDEYDPTLGIQKRGEKNDHNAFSGAELRRQHAPYFRDMDQLVRVVNQKLGRQVVFVVPTGQAVLRLREKILAGKVPGFQNQSDLFADDVGHPYEPVQVLAAYCHYAVIYHRSPVGLPVSYLLKGSGNPKYDKEGQGYSAWWYSKHPDPTKSGTPTPEDIQLTRVLQELAWDTVIHHPLTGMGSGEKTSQDEIQDAEAAQKAWIRNIQVKTEPVKKLVADAVSFNYMMDKAVDPEARSGFADRARKDGNKPNWLITASWSSFECFGRYRVTFRLKCSDPAVTNTVCQIALGGATPAESLFREIKGTDFTAANQYQDFSIELLRGDTGNFYYAPSYAGHADVSLDTITSERIGDTSDQELVEKLGAGPKYDAKPLAKLAPRMVWVQGPLLGVSHELDPFAAAIQSLKIPFQVTEVDIPGRTSYDFPKDWDELSRYSIVLLSDVNPRALGFMARKRVHDWVEQGGTLIVTGGPYAFGKGQTQGTVLEDIYPVQVSRCDLVEGGIFLPAGALPEGCTPYRGRAGSCLIHQTTAKPGAQVVLKCHGHPLLAYQKVGLGKVVVFTGTPLESDSKIRPFWADPAWGQWSARFLQSILE